MTGGCAHGGRYDRIAMAASETARNRSGVFRRTTSRRGQRQWRSRPMTERDAFRRFKRSRKGDRRAAATRGRRSRSGAFRGRCRRAGASGYCGSRSASSARIASEAGLPGSDSRANRAHVDGQRYSVSPAFDGRDQESSSLHHRRYAGWAAGMRELSGCRQRPGQSLRRLGRRRSPPDRVVGHHARAAGFRREVTRSARRRVGAGAGTERN